MGQAAWGALKTKTRELEPKLAEAKLYRTKVGCLRMCQDGPMAVCYPDGQWFRGVTADKVGEVVDYVMSGKTEPHPLQFAANPLAAGHKPKP